MPVILVEDSPLSHPRAGANTPVTNSPSLASAPVLRPPGRSLPVAAGIGLAVAAAAWLCQGTLAFAYTRRSAPGRPAPISVRIPSCTRAWDNRDDRGTRAGSHVPTLAADPRAPAVPARQPPGCTSRLVGTAEDDRLVRRCAADAFRDSTKAVSLQARQPSIVSCTSRARGPERQPAFWRLRSSRPRSRSWRLHCLAATSRIIW